MIGDVVTEEEIRACTTCGACQEVCPVNIEHIRKIIDMRRNLVMTQSNMPESAQLMLRNMQSERTPVGWNPIDEVEGRLDKWAQEISLLAEGESANTRSG